MSALNNHVALVTPWETGGGIANYSERLRDALVENFPDVAVSVVPIVAPETARPWRFDEVVRAVPADADVIHIQYEAGVFGHIGVSGVWTPTCYVRLAHHDQPVVTTLHEVHRSHPGHGTLGSAVIRGRDRLVERTVLSVSDAIVVHTEDAAAILRDRHGDHWPVRRMRHPVDEPVGTPTDRAAARKALDVDAETVLTTLGWVESKKRYEDVVRSLPDLPDPLYLVAGEPRRAGDEAVLEELFALADDLGVRDRVRHLGYVPETDLPDLFGATDLAVLPYEQVTQSGAVNTALAYRCPVVTTALPAFEELAAEYDCVLTYEDPGELVNVVWRASTADARRRLRDEADRYAATETWSAFAAETASVYDAVVSSPAHEPIDEEPAD